MKIYRFLCIGLSFLCIVLNAASVVAALLYIYIYIFMIFSFLCVREQTEGIHSIWGSGRENNGSSEKGDNLLAVYDV